MSSSTYENSTRRRQINLLRKAALDVLPAFGINDARISLLLHQMNTTFWVRDCGTGRQYVLRIHPKEGYDHQTIEAEMRYLELLNQHSHLLAPCPQRAHDGEYVRSIPVDEAGSRRSCVLMTYLTGRFQNTRLSDSALHKMGAYTAHLHRFSEEYTAELNGLSRPRYDWDGFFGPGAFACPGENLQRLEAAERDILDRASASIRRAMADLGESSQVNGFIHGDIYFRNVLYENGQVGAIDFDLCGTGWYLYDLAIPYWPRRQGDHAHAYRQVIDGYRTVRQLQEDELEYLDDFLALRRLIDVTYTLRRYDFFGRHSRPTIEWGLKALNEYLRRKSG